MCGALVGTGEAIAQAHRLRNIAARPRSHYQLDAREHLALLRQHGGRVIGYYHSHPDRPPQPSVADARQSRPGSVHLIVGVTEGAVTDASAYVSDLRGVLRPVPLQVIDRATSRR